MKTERLPQRKEVCQTLRQNHKVMSRTFLPCIAALYFESRNTPCRIAVFLRTVVC